MCFRLRLRPETSFRLIVLKPIAGSGAARVNACDIVTRRPCTPPSNGYAPLKEAFSAGLSQLTGLGLRKLPHNLREKAQAISLSSRLVAELRWETGHVSCSCVSKDSALFKP